MHIVPVSDLRNHASDVIAIAVEQQTPVFLTKNGRGTAVVLSMEQYERLTAEQDLYALLERGHRDVLEGKVKPFDEVMRSLREEFSHEDMRD